jgi:hypothetical protein
MDKGGDMFTNRDSSYLRAHVEAQSDGSMYRRDVGSSPGVVVGEFNDLWDAMLFKGMKGPQQHCITAGISHRYAVRRLGP